MAAVLACEVWWSLGQVLTLTASGPAAALAYARFELFGSSLLGPFALHLLSVVLPEPLLRRRRWLALEYAIGAVLAVASVDQPLVRARRRAHELRLRAADRPARAMGYVALLAMPGVVLVRLLSRSTLQHVSRRQLPWIEFAIGLAALVTSITDFALPALGRHVPRLGSASVALWAVITWLSVYRFRGAGLSPRTFANEILATLPDGVSPGWTLDGRIRAANAKLAQLARQAPAKFAAKNSFLQKCKKDSCEVKAVDKNGKKLAGAAKNSFMTKCEKDA